MLIYHQICQNRSDANYNGARKTVAQKSSKNVRKHSAKSFSEGITRNGTTMSDGFPIAKPSPEAIRSGRKTT